jgi:mono/diheme cytochrome c family protein
VKRWAAAAMSAVLLAAGGSSLTQEDFQYLKAKFGIAPNSGVITELTSNEATSLHSAIDDLKSYPAGQDRAVQSYLTLVYARECKRWNREDPSLPCSPPPDPAAAPGKAISDQFCASCHLFGSETAKSFHEMASGRDWNAHKVEHALHHNPGMVPTMLTPEDINELATYINSLK